MNLLRDRPVFICGHPKSGTSLLRALLDSHPQVIAYPEETAFFRRFLPAAKGLSPEEKIALADRMLTHIFEWNSENPPAHQDGYPDRTYTQFPANLVRGEMRNYLNERFAHDGDLLSAAILAFGNVSGQANPKTRYWLEKTPYNEYFTEKIFAWWEDARCIHVIRDPRDNFASYRRKHPDWDAELFALNWQKSTRTGIRNQARYGKNRYMILRYEDLTQESETTLAEIREFLGIDNHRILYIPTRAGIPWQGNSMFDDKFSGISASTVGRWKKSLQQEEVAVIEWTNRDLMKRLRYPLSGNKVKVSLSTRWRMLKRKMYPYLRRKK